MHAERLVAGLALLKSAKLLWTDTVSPMQVSEGSTVIDLTSKTPALVRDGKGAASIFVQEMAIA